MLVLLGIAVVVAGFVARLNPLAVILAAAVVTGVAASFGPGMGPAELLAAAHRLKRADMAPDKVEEWEHFHACFHRTLVAPCGSAWLLRFIAQLHDQFDRYRRMAPEAPEVRRVLDAQHGELVELALERDIKSARALMDDHIQRSYQVALQGVLSPA